MVEKEREIAPVTIAIPVYNGEDYIENAIKSILNQQCEVQEVLICDNKSTDNTIITLEKIIKNSFYDRFRVIKKSQNDGYIGNMNTCILECRTKYLRFLHADDMIAPRSICQQLECFLKNPHIALISGQEEYIYKDENLTAVTKDNNISFSYYKAGKIFEFVTEKGHYLPVSSVMLNLEKVRQVGLFPTFTLAGDEYFWLQILSKYSIVIMNSLHSIRRLHDNNLQYRWFYENKKEFVKGIYDLLTLMKYLEVRNDKKKKLITNRRRRYSKVLMGNAILVIKRNKDTGSSLWYLNKSLRLWAGSLFTIIFLKAIAVITINFIGIYDFSRNMYLKHRK